MVGVDAHPGARQYISPPEIPSHEEHFEVTVAHQRWALYMGALLSPWEGYRRKDGELNPNYGKAEVHDWKTLMEWVRGVREESKIADDEYKEREQSNILMTEKEKRARAPLHRDQCRV